MDANEKIKAKRYPQLIRSGNNNHVCLQKLMCSTIKMPATKEEISGSTAGNHEFIPLGAPLSLPLPLFPARLLSSADLLFVLGAHVPGFPSVPTKLLIIIKPFQFLQIKND